MNFKGMKLFAASMMVLGTITLFQACNGGSDGGDNGGSSASPTISAPNILSPASGSQVSETQPTLTVSNATVSTGATPTYNFQVATDDAFSTIVVQQAGVAQGSGQTSWQVTEELVGTQFFWRARAVVGATQGPFSSVANFTVTGGVSPGDVVVINDPLTTGSSAHAIDRRGGEFTDRGWRVTANSDFLRYEVDAIQSGFVMWNNTGLTRRGFNADSHMLFGMWDPTAGGFRANPFRVNVQKLWNNPHNPPFVRLRWISGGALEDAGMNFQDWLPGETYSWRLQWGPGGGAQVAKLFLDGIEILQIQYNRPYLPNTHFIEFGVAERNESVVDAVYSNIIIGTR
jgi:hypothetical protein